MVGWSHPPCPPKTQLASLPTPLFFLNLDFFFLASPKNLQIIEQAYLYRMAAAIHLDRSPLPEKVPGSGSGDHLSNYQRDKVQMFCESMNEIEKLRTGQVERLKRALQADDFPTNINISDPQLLPFLHPKAKAVVQAFPLQAEAIVKKHGLNSEEFNNMLHASKSNPIFRWKVQKHLKIPESTVVPKPATEAAPTDPAAPVPPSAPRMVSQQRPVVTSGGALGLGSSQTSPY